MSQCDVMEHFSKNKRKKQETENEEHKANWERTKNHRGLDENGEREK